MWWWSVGKCCCHGGVPVCLPSQTPVYVLTQLAKLGSVNLSQDLPPFQLIITLELMKANRCWFALQSCCCELVLQTAERWLRWFSVLPSGFFLCVHKTCCVQAKQHPDPSPTLSHNQPNTWRELANSQKPTQTQNFKFQNRISFEGRFSVFGSCHRWAVRLCVCVCVCTNGLFLTGGVTWQETPMHLRANCHELQRLSQEEAADFLPWLQFWSTSWFLIPLMVLSRGRDLKRLC